VDVVEVRLRQAEWHPDATALLVEARRDVVAFRHREARDLLAGRGAGSRARKQAPITVVEPNRRPRAGTVVNAGLRDRSEEALERRALSRLRVHGSILLRPEVEPASDPAFHN
jgi:hypothetical protein